VFRVLPRAHRGLARAWWALVLLRSLAPAVLIIATGGLVGAVSAGNRPGWLLAVVLTSSILILVLSPVHDAISADLGARVGADLHERLLRAVKLLCGFYAPAAGRILVDGTELGRIAPKQWRARLSGAFQDFARLEFLARQSIGLGDLGHLDEPEVIGAAVHRAGASDVIDGLASGLDTQLGAGWPDGVDLSFGQWQKLALARGFMRPRPLLTVLDEPTSALDAETEHALFERYAGQAGASRRDGGITVLVSHRFSTVRMADLIVVISDGRVAETGSHEELMARRGAYADLYAIQASAYR
jgi:ABC-type multidrug transport system fused ATPase/permease subunit